jgi:hypothetical protein
MKHRLDLDIYELETLKNLLTGEGYTSVNAKKSLLEKIANPIKIHKSRYKTQAAAKATSVRSAKAKAKIDNAINMLRFEAKEITHYSISKFSEVSFMTVKKYVSDDYLKSLNEI